MISVQSRTDPRYDILTLTEPFEFCELAPVAESGPGMASVDEDLEAPMLIDFRRVDLMRFSSADFRRVITRRLEMRREAAETICALIASNDAAYGMLRMYGAYAEVAGLSSARSILITLDYDEAVHWIETMARKTASG